MEMVKRKMNEFRPIDQLGKQFENLKLNDENSLKKARVESEDLQDPEIVSIQPWVLEQQGTTLSSWCLEENNIYVATDMHRFLGENMKNIPYSKRLWHCTKNGPGRIVKYRKYIETCMLSRINMLANKKLGCFCFEKEKCHCMILIQLYRENKYKYRN